MPHWSYLVTSPTYFVTLSRSLPVLKFQDFLSPRNRQVSSTYSALRSPLNNPATRLIPVSPGLCWHLPSNSFQAKLILIGAPRSLV